MRVFDIVLIVGTVKKRFQGQSGVRSRFFHVSMNVCMCVF